MYFFIFNTFGGFVSSLLRSLCSAGIVMLLLFRMDRSIYISGLEMFDTGACILQQIHVHHLYMYISILISIFIAGYCTYMYVGCLYLEYVQNHPIMNTFVQIICEKSEGEENVQFAG